MHTGHKYPSRVRGHFHIPNHGLLKMSFPHVALLDMQFNLNQIASLLAAVGESVGESDPLSNHEPPVLNLLNLSI